MLPLEDKYLFNLLECIFLVQKFTNKRNGQLAAISLVSPWQHQNSVVFLTPCGAAYSLICWVLKADFIT